MKVPFAISTTQARNKKGNNETLVNMYADTMPPNAKSQVVLIGTPGWVQRAMILTAPIIGMHRFKGDTYCVTASNLYKITDNNVVTNIGSVVFSGDYVSMADNGIEMVMVNGNGYYSDGVTVTKITDPAFYPSNTVTFQDGYFIFDRKDSNQFFISNLYSVTFDALMYASAEGSPDNIVAVLSTHQQLWIFGTQSIEVWYDSGDALFPFDRIQGSFTKRGCVAYKTISATNNTIFWVGDDNVVYMANGYTPVAVSNNSVEYQLGTRGDKPIRAYTYTEEGHYFYVLTIDGLTTMVYDIKTGLWHTRESLGKEWGLRNIIMDESGKLTGVDFANGNVYTVGLDYYTEDGQTIERRAETSPFSNGVDYFTLNKFELDMETGKSLPNEEDTITLSLSLIHI